MNYWQEKLENLFTPRRQKTAAPALEQNKKRKEIPTMQYTIIASQYRPAWDPGMVDYTYRMENITPEEAADYCKKHGVTLNKRKKEFSFWSASVDNLRITVYKMEEA